MLPRATVVATVALAEHVGVEDCGKLPVQLRTLIRLDGRKRRIEPSRRTENKRTAFAARLSIVVKTVERVLGALSTLWDVLRKQD